MASVCPRCPARLKDATDKARTMARLGSSLDIGRELSDEPVRPMNPASATEQQTTLSETISDAGNDAPLDETEQDVQEIIRDKVINNKESPMAPGLLSSHLRLATIAISVIVLLIILYFVGQP